MLIINPSTFIIRSKSLPHCQRSILTMYLKIILLFERFIVLAPPLLFLYLAYPYRFVSLLPLFPHLLMVLFKQLFSIQEFSLALRSV